MSPTRPRWTRLAPAAAVVALLAAPHAPADARPALLETTSGDTYEGELVRQTPSVVVLSVGGIEASFDRADVASLTLRDTPEEVYRRERPGLDRDDLAGRLDLAQRMLDAEALDLAELELTALARDFPEHPAVLDAAAVVEAKIRLRSAIADQPRPEVRRAAEQRDADRPGRPDRVGPDADRPYLTDAQRRLLRVYEVRLDTQPRVSINRRTLDQFFARYGDDPLVPSGRRERAAFRRQPGHEQLDLIFRVQARDLYDQVGVSPEPEPLRDFRTNLNPRYVAAFFAPTFGHGEIDGLHLFNSRPETEAEAYTNFFLLHRFRYDGRPLIDRVNPEDSLLLQWGLPREAARFPAPDVPGWRPAFTSPDEPRFRNYADWVASLYPDDLDYGITYPPAADD
ncbi:MAG: hypothetical protein AAF710_07475 [Planctomycetota bacterium]